MRIYNIVKSLLLTSTCQEKDTQHPREPRRNGAPVRMPIWAHPAAPHRKVEETIEECLVEVDMASKDMANKDMEEDMVNKDMANKATVGDTDSNKDMVGDTRNKEVTTSNNSPCMFSNKVEVEGWEELEDVVLLV